ncbi:MAG: SPOR domain-containing protein [Treponema sp.]|nr:SPOR domain-containing protein [Treponema sp.]MCL2272324.1 SPOR domain-containing protein [Treponema sp.]
MKKYIAIFIFAALVIFQSASPWEGAASIAPEGELPAAGFFVSTNSYPRNTVVDITNLENNKGTRVIVAGSLDSPGLLAIVSREAAELIGMRSGVVSRIRMVQPSEPIAYARFTEGIASGSPLFDSGDSSITDIYGEDTYIPPATAEKTEPALSAFTGPSYTLEPEWRSKEIVDYPVYVKEMPSTSKPVQEAVKEIEPVKPEPEIIKESKYVEPEPVYAAEPEYIEPEPEYIAELKPEYIYEPEPVYIAEPEYIEPEPEYITEPKPEITEESKYMEPEPVYVAEPEYIEPEPEYIAEPKPEIIEESKYVEPGPIYIAEPEYIKPEPEYIAKSEPKIIEEPKFVEPEPVYIAEPEYIEPEPEYIAEPEPEYIEPKPESIAKPEKKLEYVTEKTPEQKEYVLVPSAERPPESGLYGINPEDIIPGISIPGITTPAVATPVTPAPAAPAVTTPVTPAAQVAIPSAPPVIVVIVPQEKTVPAAAETIFSIPGIKELERGSYYVQLAAFSSPELIENTIKRIDNSYAPVVFKDADNLYRILLGPLNQGESAAILQRFKSIGYTDAFIRHVR